MEVRCYLNPACATYELYVEEHKPETAIFGTIFITVIANMQSFQ